MNAKRVVGWVLILVGIAVIGLNIISGILKNSINLAALIGVQSVWLSVAGLVILVFGVILGRGKDNQQAGEEVPIYQGKKIIGYRKEGK